MSGTPAVSVVLTTYNHERFIADAAESILRQTLGDLEVIVVDDGSTDGTWEALQGVADPRLTCLRMKNSGPSVAFNTGLRRARADYVALMSGDDVSEPTRLEVQYARASQNPGVVVFSRVRLIDDDGAPVAGHPLDSVFNDFRPASHDDLLHYLFFGHNRLNAASCLAPRLAYLDCGLFDEACIQLQDFDLWVGMVTRGYQFVIVEEPLLRYRVRRGSENLSLDPGNQDRVIFETVQVYRRFFDSLPRPDFQRIFQNDLRKRGPLTDEEFEIEKTLLYLKHWSGMIRFVGLERLYVHMRSPLRTLLETDYGITLSHYFRMLRDADFFSGYRPQPLVERIATRLARPFNRILGKQRKLSNPG